MLSSEEKAIKFLEEIQKHFLIARFGISYLDRIKEFQKLTNQDALENFIRNELNYEQASGLIEEFKKNISSGNLSNRILSTKYEIFPLSFVLEAHFLKILKVAKEYNLTSPDIPYIGTVLSDQYNAFACRIPETDENLILLDNELFFLASILSKIITLSLPEFKYDENTITFCTDKDKIEKHINGNPEILHRFKILIYDYFYLKRNIKYFKPDKIFFNFRYNLITSLELFILAHEYGHIISGHLEQSLRQEIKFKNINVEKINPQWEQEYEADQIGLKLMLKAIEVDGQLPFCYLGTDLFFAFLDTHERALLLFKTGENCKPVDINSHPPTRLRREKIKNHIKSYLPEKNVLIYNEFSQLIDNIIEILWGKFKIKWNHFKSAHRST